jgi:hypothetical protein
LWSKLPGRPAFAERDPLVGSRQTKFDEFLMFAATSFTNVDGEAG